MGTRNGFRVWDDEFDREFFTPEEIAESDLRASLVAAQLARPLPIRSIARVTQSAPTITNSGSIGRR